MTLTADQADAPGALLHTRVASPLGDLLLVGRHGVLSGLFLADHERCRVPEPQWIRDDGAFDDVRRQLDEYFAGTRTSFELQLEPKGNSFQLRVWQALREIPFGETISYGMLARRIGRATGSRAVGGANARNPISVIVPCHRVVGADGALSGYGWGQERKAWLLDHERRTRAGQALPRA